MEAWLTDVEDTTNLQAQQQLLRFLLEGGAHRERKRKHRSDASASATSSKGRRTAASSNCTSADGVDLGVRAHASSVDNSSRMCVEMFFDSAESGSNKSDSGSEEEGRECEPSNRQRAQPLSSKQLRNMDNILQTFVEQPSGGFARDFRNASG